MPPGRSRVLRFEEAKKKRRSLPSGRLGALPIPAADLKFCPPKSRPSFAPALSERERPALGGQTADRSTLIRSRALNARSAIRQESSRREPLPEARHFEIIKCRKKQRPRPSFALTRKGGRGPALPSLYSYCTAKCGIGIYFMDCIQLTLKGRPIRR